MEHRVVAGSDWPLNATTVTTKKRPRTTIGTYLERNVCAHPHVGPRKDFLEAGRRLLEAELSHARSRYQKTWCQAPPSAAGPTNEAEVGDKGRPVSGDGGAPHDDDAEASADFTKPVQHPITVVSHSASEKSLRPSADLDQRFGGWFAPAAQLGSGLLDGTYGAVCIDVRLQGRLVSKCPEVLDDLIQRIMCGLADGRPYITVDAPQRSCCPDLEVFCWTVSSGHAFEITACGSTLVDNDHEHRADKTKPAQVMPAVVFLAALLAAPAVRKVCVHLTPILRFICVLLGTRPSLEPRNCVDLSLVDAVLCPFSNLAPSLSHLPLAERLTGLVDPLTMQCWETESQRRMSLHHIESVGQHRGLDAVECQLRIIAHAYAAAAERIELHQASYQQSSSPTDEDTGLLPLSPLDVDMHCEWLAVCMSVRGLHVAVDDAQAALDTLRVSVEECLQRFVSFLDDERGASDGNDKMDSVGVAVVPDVRMDDFFSGKLEPATAWLCLTHAMGLSAESAGGAREDPMVLLERLASSSSGPSANSDGTMPPEGNEHRAAAAARAYVEATAISRCAEEIKSWVRRFTLRSGPSAPWKVHPTWTHKPGTTGRTFASKPNVQTLPKRQRTFVAPSSCWLPHDVAKRVFDNLPPMDPPLTVDENPPTILRYILRGPPGTLLISVDFSQIELRVCAHLTKDPELLRIFQEAHHNDTDVFLGIADALFREHIAAAPSEGSVVDHLRRHRRAAAKTMVYSILYGMSTEGVAELLHARGGYSLGENEPSGAAMTEDQLQRQAWREMFPDSASAQTAVQRFFQHFSSVSNYILALCDRARRTGAVRGVLRTRFLPASPQGLPGQDRAAVLDTPRAKLDRTVVSMAIQGSASDVLKLAAHQIDRGSSPPSNSGIPHGRGQPPSTRPVLVCSAHDELVYAVPASKAEEVRAWLTLQFEAVGPLLKLAVPLEAHTSVHGYLA